MVEYEKRSTTYSYSVFTRGLEPDGGRLDQRLHRRPKEKEPAGDRTSIKRCLHKVTRANKVKDLGKAIREEVSAVAGYRSRLQLSPLALS